MTRKRPYSRRPLSLRIRQWFRPKPKMPVPAGVKALRVHMENLKV